MLAVLRRDLLDEIEAPQGDSCGIDDYLKTDGCTEGYLDGPYDFGYSRIERYMDTSEHSNSDNGAIKAQSLSFSPGNF